MRATQSDVLRRLCHLVPAWTGDGRTSNVEEIILLVAANSDGDNKWTVTSISAEIDQQFGIKIADYELLAALDALTEADKISYESHEAKYEFPELELSTISERIVEAAQLEQVVKEEWVASLQTGDFSTVLEHFDEAWNCILVYLANQFYENGVETLEFLKDSYHPANVDIGRWKSFSFVDCSPNVSKKEMQRCIANFLSFRSEVRDQFLSQLLVGTVSLLSLAVDETVAGYFQDEMQPLTIFLDTNVIFGVLGLNDTPMVDVSRMIVETVQRFDLPVSFVVLSDSIQEYEHAWRSARVRLTRYPSWQQSVSQAVLGSYGTSGIDLRYHELNAQRPTSPSAFVQKFRYVRELLDERGIKVFDNEKNDPFESATEKGLWIAEYDEYINQHRPNNPKHHETLAHDMVLLFTVRARRDLAVNALRSGSLALTLDRSLFYFDRTKLTNDFEIGSVMLPNHLLQLLQPLVPMTDDFRRTLVEAFALPVFRAISPPFDGVAAEVASLLNLYDDIDPETASRILADQMLMTNLQDLDPNSEVFQEQIESALARDNADLLEERERLEDHLQETFDELERYREKVRTQEEIAMAHEGEIASQRAEIARILSIHEENRSSLKELQRQNEETRSQLRTQAIRSDSDKKRTTRVLTFLTSLLGILLIILIIENTRVGSLIGTTASWSVSIFGGMAWAGASYALFNANHRSNVIFGVVIVAFVACISVLLGA